MYNVETGTNLIKIITLKCKMSNLIISVAIFNDLFIHNFSIPSYSIPYK